MKEMSQQDKHFAINLRITIKNPIEIIIRIIKKNKLFLIGSFLFL